MNVNVAHMKYNLELNIRNLVPEKLCVLCRSSNIDMLALQLPSLNVAKHIFNTFESGIHRIWLFCA